MSDNAHTTRINTELAAAGMTGYGLQKLASRSLPEIIHKDEHIGGIVYGRYTNGSGMLVATDRRVIFLDKKPLFSTNEEVSYDVVSGFKINKSGLVNSITLHTRVKDFDLKYVNVRCASIFKKYIESRTLEDTSRPAKPVAAKIPTGLTPEAIDFLIEKDVAVLSTANKKGDIHGAVVYYVTDEQHTLYVLTKADTTKAKDVLARPKVAVTIFDANIAQTLQLQASATIESDEAIKRQVFNNIMKPHKYKGGYKLPPVAWLDAGMFVIIRIAIETANYSDFSNKSKSKES